jgi:hypothetical protein
MMIFRMSSLRSNLRSAAWPSQKLPKMKMAFSTKKKLQPRRTARLAVRKLSRPLLKNKYQPLKRQLHRMTSDVQQAPKATPNVTLI